MTDVRGEGMTFTSAVILDYLYLILSFDMKTPDVK
jgi:hypothetical protein